MRLSKGMGRKAISIVILGCGAYATLASADQSIIQGVQGFDLGVGLAIQSFNYGAGSQTNDGSSVETFDASSGVGLNAVFNAGYNFMLPANHWVLGVQAAFQPLHVATTTQKNPGTLTQEKVSNRYEFSVLPGYLITSDTVVYGKIGYSLANEHIDNKDGAWNTTLHYKGYTAGFGVKSFVLGNMMRVKNLYTFAEYNYAGYGGERYAVINTGGHSVVSSNLKLHANEGVLGVGYVF